jgi:YggT family protein
VRLVFWVLQLLVFARVIISWVRVDRHHPLVRFIYQVTEPMLRPFRAVLRIGPGGLDFSPIILLFVLWIAQQIIITLLTGL